MDVSDIQRVLVVGAGGCGRQIALQFARFGFSAVVHDISQGQLQECRFLTVHRPGWEEVGMAARPESRFMLERAQHRLMPVCEGIEHLLHEIESGIPVTDVVVANPDELGPDFLDERRYPQQKKGTACPGRAQSS